MDFDTSLLLLHELAEVDGLSLPREIIVERRFPPVAFTGDPADWMLESEVEYCDRRIADPEVIDKQDTLARKAELEAELQRRARLAYRRVIAPYEFKDVIERVRKIDVVAVITARAPATAHSMKHEGGLIRALCPFHSEHTPSFAMWPDIGGYRCFGCEEHGDCISAVMKLDGLQFTPAVLALCREFGIEPPLNPARINTMDIPTRKAV